MKACFKCRKGTSEGNGPDRVANFCYCQLRQSDECMLIIAELSKSKWREIYHEGSGEYHAGTVRCKTPVAAENVKYYADQEAFVVSKKLS